jgi:hypothetical protein
LLRQLINDKNAPYNLDVLGKNTGHFVRLCVLQLNDWVRPHISGEAANTCEADEALSPDSSIKSRA